MIFIRMIFELLVYIPMPWQFLIAFFLIVRLGTWGFRLLFWAADYLISMLKWFIEKGTALILLPEYIFTTLLRNLKLKFLLGISYFYDDIFVTIGALLYSLVDKLGEHSNIKIKFPALIFFLISGTFIALWSLRPELEGTLVAEYFDKAVFLWNDFCQKMLQAA